MTRVMMPERDKRPGVRYAVTEDGLELPVLDVTNPAFQGERWSEAELREIESATLRSLLRSERVPRFIHRLIASRSIIMRGTLAAERSFLPGMTTYLQKLGPELVSSGYASKVDRHLLASIGPVAVRMRVRQVASRLAEQLGPRLERRGRGGGGGELHLLNIGGGTSTDSINAVLLLRRQRPELLDGRRVRIHVQDIDAAGPAFAKRALLALQAPPEGPLAGLDIDLEHTCCSWTDAAALRAILRRFAGDDVVAVGSSEGGIFEYGSDAEVAALLAILRDETPGDFLMIGSLARDIEVLRTMRRLGKLAWVLREIDAFRELVQPLGWTVCSEAQPNPLYYVVVLEKAGAAQLKG